MLVRKRHASDHLFEAAMQTDIAKNFHAGEYETFQKQFKEMYVLSAQKKTVLRLMKKSQRKILSIQDPSIPFSILIVCKAESPGVLEVLEK